MEKLSRLRLELDRRDADLLLVGDRFEEGGRYVQLEIPRNESALWSWLDWSEVYDRLADEWRRRFECSMSRPGPLDHHVGVDGDGRESVSLPGRLDDEILWRNPETEQ
jgi:hypothetical protein